MTTADHTDTIIAEAEIRAHKALEGADLSMSWCEAGYHTALDAARVLVGDTGEPEIDEYAATLVASLLCK